MPPIVLSLWHGPINRTTLMHDIAERVARIHELTVEELRGHRIDRGTAHARQQAMAEMRAAGKTYPAIGKFFGRDHTTVMWAAKRHRERAGRD